MQFGSASLKCIAVGEQYIMTKTSLSHVSMDTTANWEGGVELCGKKNLKSFKSITFPVTVICLSSHHFVPRKMRFVVSPKAFRMVEW